MPIYEYRCLKCGKKIELYQKSKDIKRKHDQAEITKCDGDLESLFSTFGLKFVGNGWYVTDYKRKKSQEKV
jgi:putative FmdB family regulatory protein